MKTYR